MTTTTAEKPPRNAWRWVWRSLIAALLITAGAIAFLTGTSTGLRLSAGLASGAADKIAGIDLRIEDIRGSLWGRLQIATLRLKGPDGLNIAADDLTIDWSPLALSRSVLDIQEVSARRLAADLPPASPEPAPETAAEPFSLPRIGLRLEKLNLPEISVGLPDLADPLLLSAVGDIIRTAEGETTATLAVQPLATSLDRLALTARHSQSGETLNLTLDAVMTRDGLFAGLAGLQETLAGPVTLSLNGSGPLSGWQGNLSLDYGDLLTLKSDVAASLSDNQWLRLDGVTDLRQPGALSLPDLLSGKIRHAVSVKLLEDDNIAIDGLNISLPERFTLTGDARSKADLSDITATLDLQLDPSVAALAGPGIGWDDVFLTTAIAGNPARPEIDLVASATRLSVDNLLKADASLSGRLTGSSGNPYKLDLSTIVSDIIWSDGIPGGLIGSDASIIIAATAEPDFSRFTLTRADIDAGDLSVRAKASATATGQISGTTLTLTYADIAGLHELTGLDLAGRADLTLTDFSGDTEQGFRGKLSLRGQKLTTGISDLDRLAGNSPVISSGILLTGDGNLTLNDLAVRAGALSIDGQTTFSATDEQISVDLSGAVAPDGLPSQDSIAFSAAPQFAIKLKGPATKLAGTISLSLASLKLAGFPVEKIRLDNRVSWSGDSPSVSVTLAGNIARQALTASTTIRAETNDLALDSLKLSLPGIQLAGDLKLPGYGPAIAGKLRLDIRHGEALTALAGMPLKLSGDVGIDLAAVRGRQTVTIQSDLASLRLEDATGAETIRLDRVTVAARIDDALTTPQLTADLRTRGVTVPGGTVSVARLNAEGGLDSLSYQLTAEGRFGKPLTTDISGNLAMSDTGITAAIDRGNIIYDGLKTTITEPLRVALQNGEPREASGKLAVANGTVSLDYTHTGKTAGLTLDLAGIDLAKLAAVAEQPGLTGKVGMNLAAKEAAGKVTATMELAMTGLRSEDFPSIDPISIRLSGDLKDNRLKLKSDFDGIDLERTALNADIPVTVSLTAPSASLASDGPLDVTAVLVGDLGRIWPLLPLPEHQMTGRFEIDATARGSVDKPVLSGEVTITDGHYEHLEYGTQLNAITLDAAFSDDRLIIKRFDATDAGTGRLSVTGQAALGGGKPVFDVAFTMNGVKLVHRDDIEVLASADIKATGDEAGGKISGGLTVNRAELNLNAALPPSVASVEVENDPGRKEEPAETAPAYPMTLDLYLDVPGKAFVRGRGLDSEWAGRLDVKGTADQPIVTGSLNAVRGQLDLVGKSFDIKNSSVSFGGGVSLDPKLNIAGVHTTDDLTVTAEVVGVASKPEIRLSSVPALPRDEVLSRVLFGTGKGNLGPLEAAQLAAAAAELSGATGNGPGILGRIRNIAGVDVLRVEDGANGPAVAAGKYVAEGVYVGAKQGSKPGSSGVEVEVEITPNISVKSEAGQTGDSNIGVQFKWDY